MKVFVKVITNAKREKTARIDENNFKVWTKEPPIEGRANKKIVKMLAEYMGISPHGVTIISGHKSEKKILKIN